ncbi:MAG: hypothetical protein AB7U73_05255 [Pirellulales bacterium]
MYPSRRPVSLQQYFAGLTEQTFQSRLGVADPPLVDYLADLLVRFVRSDAVFRVRDLNGRTLSEVAAMIAAACERVGDSRRDVHRHIGDFTLFWTGVYPEALARLQAPDRRDHLLDYPAQGKRAYYIASTLGDEETADECALLARLSHEFDMCVYGLGEVRRQWEQKLSADGSADGRLWID